MVSLNVNGLSVEANATPDTPLLWVLRDHLGLTGTKFGCGIAQCGACTVHLDGRPVRSCVLPVGLVKERAVTTIEAIGQTQAGQKVQEAWLDLEVVQCGYCQSGQIMAAAALLKKKPSDYMRDMYFTSQPMEMVDNREALQLTFKMINAETQLVWSSDYPHWDFDLPSTIYDLPFLNETSKRNILGANAARLFNLDPKPVKKIP